MTWLSDVFSGTIGGLVDSIGKLADRFITTPDEKKAFELELQKLVEAKQQDAELTLRSEIESRERVLVAELSQEDKMTKRARPSVVYAGLFYIFLNYCLFPIVAYSTGHPPIELPLPDAFWVGWSGIVMMWTIGRTMEKRGDAMSKPTQIITGAKPSSRILS